MATSYNKYVETIGFSTQRGSHHKVKNTDNTTSGFFMFPSRYAILLICSFHPQTILTDEDAEMAKAISKVLPFAHHKLCVWHVNQNACKHLAGVVPNYKKFNADFQHCIYDI
jgi:zinc finger SWIM domain-containing protein 3